MTDAFDSAFVNIMSRALDIAWRKLGGSGLQDAEREGAIKAALTKAIVEAANRGERDEAKLAVYAVDRYRQSKADGLNSEPSS